MTRPWRPPLKATLCATALMALSACSSLPASSPPGTPGLSGTSAPGNAVETIQGQFSLKLGAFEAQAARGVSLGFFFSGNEQAGQLDLMTLMGSQVARVNWQGDQAWLEDQHGRRTFASLDELSLQTLGEPLPLRALVYWMQGQPASFLPSQDGPMSGQFEQAGWLIDTRELGNKRLQALRPGTPTSRAVTLKIYLDR